jgi:hypothetical protein
MVVSNIARKLAIANKMAPRANFPPDNGCGKFSIDAE